MNWKQEVSFRISNCKKYFLSYMINLLTSTPLIWNLSIRQTLLLPWTHKSIKNFLSMAKPSYGPGHFTFVLGWGFVGRWQGANEKLMSPHLANCQAQDARIRAFVWISTVQRREGLGDSQLWIEKLDYPGLHLPLLRKGLFQDNSILSLGSMGESHFDTLVSYLTVG